MAWIEGPGALIVRETGAPVFRIFAVAPEAALAPVGVTLRGGFGGLHEGAAQDAGWRAAEGR